MPMTLFAAQVDPLVPATPGPEEAIAPPTVVPGQPVVTDPAPPPADPGTLPGTEPAGEPTPTVDPPAAEPAPSESPVAPTEPEPTVASTEPEPGATPASPSPRASASGSSTAPPESSTESSPAPVVVPGDNAGGVGGMEAPALSPTRIDPVTNPVVTGPDVSSGRPQTEDAVAEAEARTGDALSARYVAAGILSLVAVALALGIAVVSQPRRKRHTH